MIANAEAWSAVAGISAAVAACVSLVILLIQIFQKKQAHVHVSSERIWGERVPRTYFIIANSGTSVARDVQVKVARIDNATHVVSMPSDIATDNEITLTIGDLAPNSTTKRLSWASNAKSNGLCSVASRAFQPSPVDEHQPRTPTNVLILPSSTETLRTPQIP